MFLLLSTHFCIAQKDSALLRLTLGAEYGNVFYLSSYNKSIKYKYSLSVLGNFGIGFNFKRQGKNFLYLKGGVGRLFLNRTDRFDEFSCPNIVMVTNESSYHFIGLRYNFYLIELCIENKLKKNFYIQNGIEYRNYQLTNVVGNYSHQELYYTPYGIWPFRYELIEPKKVSSNLNSLFYNFSIGISGHRNLRVGLKNSIQIYEYKLSILSRDGLLGENFRNNCVRKLNLYDHPISTISITLDYKFL